LIIQHGYGKIVITIVKNVKEKEMMKTINAIFVETISISIGIKPKEMVSPVHVITIVQIMDFIQKKQMIKIERSVSHA
jgi:hypothetical protein